MAAGKRHLPLRAQRALKGMGLIGKKGKTAGVPLLVRLPRAAALPAHLGEVGTHRARNARYGAGGAGLFVRPSR